jgi:hypothetical protein
MIRDLSEHYLAHRFDLLGSGWTQVVHGKACRGLDAIRFPAAEPVLADVEGRWLQGRINAANLAEARRLWRMVSPGYRPIDWQLDFKSGFRWSESKHAGEIRFGDRAGADVKLPWELGRMQHLAQLAHAYRLAAAGAEGFAAPERYAREFRDEVLDFLACNPPRYGVNWASPMDVAIRAANMLAARDLFIAAGAAFDEPFEQAFERSVYEHASHVWRTLDWHPRYRGNHYLCEIAGLLFAASYLAPTGETRRWRRRALRALQVEAQRQFLGDGGSFEASTGYHRLSGEALVYASALAASELPPEHFAQLVRVASFCAETARPDGLAPQIGDQDSGRFLKLAIRCRPTTVKEVRAGYANLEGYGELPDDAVYWDEELRDHRHLVAAAAGLLGSAAPEDWQLETELVAGLAKSARAAPPIQTIVRSDGMEFPNRLIERLRALPDRQRRRYAFVFGSGARKARAFPDFGLYVLRSERSFACVRCGPIGLNGLGAHAHNDALAVELVCEGRDVTRDPGSYLYTPLPEERDRYRSVGAHFAPRVGASEPGTLGPGPFRLGDEARASCLYFGGDGFLGVHHGYGAPVYRLLSFSDTMLVIEDFSEGAALEEPADQVPYSPKYGVRLR